MNHKRNNKEPQVRIPVTTELESIPVEIEVERLPCEEERLIELGQWYWCKDENPSSSQEPFLNNKNEMLMCVVHVGTNYALFKAPSDYGHFEDRIHFKDFSKECRFESNADDVLKGKVEGCRQKSKALMLEVQEITALLGVTPRVQLEEGQEKQTTALATLSGQENPHEYKEALIKAKKETLPKLFEQIKKSNELMANWMRAEVMPMEAKAGMLTKVIDKIEDRIFNVEIYAGLTEQVVQVRDGDPAELKEKLHFFQRRHYMDEECLIGYRHGGMEFKNIEAFDKWISEDENMFRLLPFNRCIVAFKVRRKIKDRPRNLGLNLKMELDRSDEYTFMYIRNGDQLFRMTTKLEFGEKIFPDTKEFNPNEKLWTERSWREIGHFITDDDYQERKRKCEELEPLVKKAKEKSRKADEKRSIVSKKLEKAKCGTPEHEELQKAYGEANQHCGDLWREEHPFEYEYRQNNVSDYIPFNPKSVYYDDMNKKLNDQLKQYNRIALILQGLYDRSPVLHPHPPIQLWTPEGFGQAIKLIYDQDKALAPAYRPDIKAYIAKCNERLKAGSVSIGQELLWESHEAEKECKQRERSWRSSDYRPERYRPDGNDGPGYLARVIKITRTGKATFNWTRERQTEGYGRDGKWHGWRDPIPCKMTFHKDDLFCVDGYKLGDFKQFFNDPRTRAEYLKWAPMLLAAEEYLVGNLKLKVGESDGQPGIDKW